MALKVGRHPPVVVVAMVGLALDWDLILRYTNERISFNTGTLGMNDISHTNYTAQCI